MNEATDIEIVEYASSMVDDLAAFFADLVDGIPHTTPLSPDEIEIAMSGNERRKNRRIQPEKKWIALSDGEIVGFALAGQKRTVSMQPSGNAVIRFLGYKRGLSRAGRILLDSVEAHCTDQGASSLTAFPRAYPFARSLPQPSLTNHLGHIQGILSARGFVRQRGHVRLEWTAFSQERVPEDCPLEFKSEVTTNADDLPSLRVTAFLEGVEIGVYLSCPFLTTDQRKGEGPWLSVNDLYVAEDFQGKGYGQLTLQRGLHEAEQLGYRSAVIGVNENNGRALALYVNIGFYPVDWTYDFHKEL